MLLESCGSDIECPEYQILIKLRFENIFKILNIAVAYQLYPLYHKYIYSAVKKYCIPKILRFLALQSDE